MKFDNLTLGVLNVITPLVFIIFPVFSLSKEHRHISRGVFLVNLFSCLGFFLLLFQGQIDNFFSIILANFFIILSFLILNIVSLDLVEIKVKPWVAVMIMLIMETLFLLFTYVDFNTFARITVLTWFFIILNTTSSSILIWKFKTMLNRKFVLFLAAVLLFFIPVSLLRFFQTLLLFSNIESIFDSDIATSLAMIFNIAFLISWNIAALYRVLAISEYKRLQNSKSLQGIQENILLMNTIYEQDFESKNFRENMEQIFLVIEERFEVDMIAFFRLSGTGKRLSLFHQHGFTKKMTSMMKQISVDHSIFGESFQNSKGILVRINDYPESPLKKEFVSNDIGIIASYPINTNEEWMGSLFLAFKKPHRKLEENTEEFFYVCRQIATVLSNYALFTALKESQQRLYELATTDELTGLANRREFIRRFERLFLSAKRYGTEITFFILDIDDFKEINDTYGHSAGDKVLQDLSSVLNERFRKTDIIARYGGEEFVGVFSHTDEESVERILDEFIAYLGEHTIIIDDQELSYQVSIGISQLNDFDEFIDDVVKRADIALYEAKRNGKNQLRYYSAS